MERLLQGRRAWTPRQPALHRRQGQWLPAGQAHWKGHFGDDIPSPTGPWQALGLQESGACVLFRVWASPTAAGQSAGLSILGPRFPTPALGPGPPQGWVSVLPVEMSKCTAHHSGRYLQQCTRMTDSNSSSVGTESLGPGWFQLTLTPWRRQDPAGRNPSRGRVFTVAPGHSAPVGGREAAPGLGLRLELTHSW